MFKPTANNDLGSCGYDVTSLQGHNLRPNNRNNQAATQLNTANSGVLYHELQPVNPNIVDYFYDNNYYVGQQPSFNVNQQSNFVDHFDDDNYNNQNCVYDQNQRCLYDDNFSSLNNIQQPYTDKNQFAGHQCHFSGCQDQVVQNAVQLYDPTQGLCQQNDLDLCYADIPQLSHQPSSYGKLQNF